MLHANVANPLACVRAKECDFGRSGGGCAHMRPAPQVHASWSNMPGIARCDVRHQAIHASRSHASRRARTHTRHAHGACEGVREKGEREIETRLASMRLDASHASEIEIRYLGARVCVSIYIIYTMYIYKESVVFGLQKHRRPKALSLSTLSRGGIKR